MCDRTNKEKYDIANILNDTKGIMAKKYCDHILENHTDSFEEFTVFDRSKKRKLFRFWQPGGRFDRNLWNAKTIHHSIKYMEDNPVRKKLISSPEEYLWSSAYSRVNQIGVIPGEEPGAGPRSSGEVNSARRDTSTQLHKSVTGQLGNRLSYAH